LIRQGRSGRGVLVNFDLEAVFAEADEVIELSRQLTETIGSQTTAQTVADHPAPNPDDLLDTWLVEALERSLNAADDASVD
jgi:hypothetical protein